jgi:hypothetical protein
MLKIINQKKRINLIYLVNRWREFCATDIIYLRRKCDADIDVSANRC